MGGRNPQKPPWSDLPPELLSSIAKTLISNPIDILTFRSVCNSWRNSFPSLSDPPLLSPPLPISIPCPPFSSNSGSSILSVTVIYAIRRPLDLSLSFFESLSPTSFFLFLDEFDPGKVSVRKPLSNASNDVPVNFPKFVNFVDFDLMELGRFYNLTYKYDDQSIRKRPKLYPEDVDKVVLCFDGLAVIALLKEGKLGMIRLDLGINQVGEWEIIHDGNGFQFDDIVEFKGRVLGIDRGARVYEIGYLSSKINPVVPPIANGGGRRKRLVVSLGVLYLVVRCNVRINKRKRKNTREVNEKKIKFKVYELNEVSNKWAEILSLGDRSFFFGREYSFSVSAQESGSCGENCILFVRQSFPPYNRDCNDGILFGKLNSFLYIGVWHLDDGVDLVVIESYPDYSYTLWPPPHWIWQVDRLKRFELVEAAVDELLHQIPDSFKAKVKEQSRKEAFLKTIAGEVLEFKKKVTRFQEEENKIVWIDNHFQEIILLHGHEESMDKLNQIDNMLFENATNKLGPHHTRPLRMIRSASRGRDASLFRLEEDTANMLIRQKERIAYIMME